MSDDTPAAKRRAVGERKVRVPLKQFEDLPQDLRVLLVEFVDGKDFAMLSTVSRSLKQAAATASEDVVQRSVKDVTNLVEVLQAMAKFPKLHTLKLEVTDGDVGLPDQKIRSGFLELKERLTDLEITTGNPFLYCGYGGDPGFLSGMPALQRLVLRLPDLGYPFDAHVANVFDAVHLLNAPALRELELPAVSWTIDLTDQSAAAVTRRDELFTRLRRLRTLRTQSRFDMGLSGLVRALVAMPDCETLDVSSKATDETETDDDDPELNEEWEALSFRTQLLAWLPDAKSNHPSAHSRKLRTLLTGQALPRMTVAEMRRWLQWCPRWRMASDDEPKLELDCTQPVVPGAAVHEPAPPEDIAAIVAQWLLRIDTVTTKHTCEVHLYLPTVDVVRSVLQQPVEIKVGTGVCPHLFLFANTMDELAAFTDVYVDLKRQRVQTTAASSVLFVDLMETYILDFGLMNPSGWDNDRVGQLFDRMIEVLG